MVHAAIHDAVNAIDRRSRPYAFDAEASNPPLRMPPLPRPPATCSSRSSRGCRNRRNVVRAASPAPRPPMRPRSPRYPRAGQDERRGGGQAAAAAIIALRAGDGSDAPMVDHNYPQGTEPGEWRFTPDFPAAWRSGRTGAR